MNKFHSALRLARLTRSIKPFADRIGMLPLGSEHCVRYGRLKFFARAGVGDFSVLSEVFIHQSYRVALEPACVRGAIVVDIGCNIGAFSIAAAALGARRVIAFEPDRSNAAMVRRNADLNGLQVELVEKAVGSETGKRKFFHDESEAGGGTLYPSIHAHWKRKGVPAPTVVECIRLEEDLKSRGIGQVDLLKLDCEGAEFEIFASLEGTLLNIRRIIFEYHSDGKKDASISLLERMGFHCHRPNISYQVIVAEKP